ncbi:MAG TPA: DUF3306 domain-containing protein [Azonexus sp.]|nr:DUF3306 domain-containing protein [Azonexus sp.]
MSAGGFLERWSRLKKVAETASTAEIPDAEALLANLTADSDFGQFMRQEISEEIRRKAMKTLFADPHFNVMDGLDIYIDDYSISEPIPAEMLATLNQMRAFSEPSPEEAAPVADLPALPKEAGDCDILATDGQNVPLAPPADRSDKDNQ